MGDEERQAKDHRRNEEKSRDAVQAALSEFKEAWFSGDRLDPDVFCGRRPECGPELRDKIEDFIYVAEGFSDRAISDGGKPSQGERESEAVFGEVLGDFRILREIGRGGMGTVFEAEQISLRRRVALKVLSTHLRLSVEAVIKFHREAEAGGRQSHPGIVSVYAVGEHEGSHYIAQELVEGDYTLSDKLEGFAEGEELPKGYFREAAGIVCQVAEALGHAHASGVIHRDIKPSNILLTKDGQPKVTDFGLAKIEDVLSLSRTGDLAGTPYYMSPEQVMSHRLEVDKRTDVYSLGVTLYELLTMKRPFDGVTSHEVLKKIITMDPDEPHRMNSRVPRDLSVICLKAMEKDPDRRYQDMEALAEDLYRYLSGDVIVARPAGLRTRSFRWVKRHPVTSTAVGVSLLVILLFSVVVPWVITLKEKEKREAAEAARVEIERQRNEAVSARKEAEEQTRIAEERYKQITRLSDHKLLADLKEEAEALWPAYPESIPGLRSWLKRAEDLLCRLDMHRLRLDALRAEALPYDDDNKRRDRETHPRWNELLDLEEEKSKLADQVAELGGGDSEELRKSLDDLEAQIKILEEEVSRRRTWKFADLENHWQHGLLEELVTGLEEFSDEDSGTWWNVKNRLAFATTVREESIDKHWEDWDRAIASIADRDECPMYRGLVIEPQVGMVPIDRDPESGLWEFAHLQTGAVPERGPDGKLELFEEMGLVFVLIPGGTFDMGAVRPSLDRPMGSPNVDPQARYNEEPVHTVNVKPFFISKYEMTQEQWARFNGNNPSVYNPGLYSSGIKVTWLHPVEQVSWKDCHLLLDRMMLRFPTEAEWEYAARAGTTTVWHTGNEKESLDGSVNLCDKFCRDKGGQEHWSFDDWLNDGHSMHAPVGQFLPNPFGLHDVYGNVCEWCQDCYGLYDKTPVDGTAHESRGSLVRIYRGGSWINTHPYARSAFRTRIKDNSPYNYLGLRPAASLR